MAVCSLDIVFVAGRPYRSQVSNLVVDINWVNCISGSSHGQPVELPRLLAGLGNRSGLQVILVVGGPAH